MRVMVMWASKDREMEILFNTLAVHGYKVVYWAGEEAGKYMTPKGAVFHDHYEAREARPANTFREVLYAPPSDKRLNELRDLESIILTMMNKRYDSASVEERKHIYYEMLAYWTFVFEEVRPEAIVFPAVPHAIYDFIVYWLAKERGLPTIMFEDTWVAGRLIWFTDYKTGSEAFANAVKKNSSRHVKLEDLHEDLQTYFASQTGETQIKPVYMLVQQSQSKSMALLLHRLRIARSALFRGDLFKLAFSFVRKIMKQDLSDEYRSVARKPDLDTPFVYFPLGFQPERTTSPQGGVYHDQVLVAQTISAALPDGWELYIKEHPSQWWFRSKTQYNCVRYPGYYRRLAALPRVRVVPINTDSHTLIERSKTVATITGTAGWEALFRLKKPLVFGYPWYIPVPILKRVSSVEDCKNAFEDIRRESHISPDVLLSILKSFEESTQGGVLGQSRDHLGKLHHDISTEPGEVMKVAANIVVNELERSLLNEASTQVV